MINQTISHYKILEKLGEGGMGVVYKAEDMKLKRTVALKFLPHHLITLEEDQARFLQEAQAAATLNHPNVCTIHDIQEHDGQQFIVMEYVDGVTLREKIQQAPLKTNDATSYAIQIGEALQEAHSKGIVHRDIKADNIMLNTKNQIKVMDFGLAKLKGSLKLTRSSSTVGTLAYMAPEQIQGGKVDARSDIFSFGVVVYEMLTGRTPFRGEHEAAMMYSILNEEPEPIQKDRPELSSEFLHILNRSLEKDPEDRYQSVSEMVIDLRRLKKESSRVSRAPLAEMPVTKPQEAREPAPQPEVPSRIEKPGGRRFVIPATIAGVLLLVTIGYFSFFGEPAESGERIPIAVADFVNETGEKELNGLSGMLITSLEQSRRLAVLTRSRMFDVLKLLGKEDVDQIDENLGREICRQANVSALVIASIRKFGQLYTIDLKVLDPRENEYLFTAREEGQGQESVPSMIDKLSEKTRIGLKEKAEEIASASEKVANVTTTNLEAYQHYFLGEQLMDRAEFKESEAEYRKAIELDPTFGLAYYRLTYAISWYAGSSQKAKASMQKALELIDRIPEKERYMVRALSAFIDKGEQAGIIILREMEQIYPNDKEMLYNIGDWSYHANQYATAAEYLEKVLAMDPTFERALQHLVWTYGDLGQYDKSLEYANRLVAVNEKEGILAIGRYHSSKGERATAADYYEKAYLMDPTDEGTLSILVRVYENTRQYDKALEYAKEYVSQARSPLAYGRLAAVYVLMNDFSNAFETYELGLQLFRDDPSLLVGKGRAYAFKGDYEKAEEEFKTMTMGDRGVEVQKEGLEGLATLYAYLGKYSQAKRAYDRRIEFAWKEKDTVDVAFTILGKAMRIYWGHLDKEEALKEVQRIVNFTNIRNQNYYGFLADVYYHLGELEKARTAAEKVSAIWWTDRLEAREHHAKKNWEKAVSLYERIIARNPDQQPYCGYLAALCYFELGELNKAVEEIRAAQSYFGGAHWLAHSKGLYVLGKIYEKKGDPKLAVENYEKFLNLWKDADNDLPDLLDAKARLGKLKGIAEK